MSLLIAGILLWMLVHSVPTMMPNFRTGLIDKFGIGPYKGIFALSILLAIVLMVFGWRNTQAIFLYQLPGFTRHIGMLLVVIAFVLMGVANYNSRIKQFIRHPQLTGVAVWATAHLLMNGDSRSLVLFGGMLLWSVAEIVLINQRDGEYQKPELPSWGKEIMGLGISGVVFVVFVFLHPYISGMPIVP